MKHCVNCGRNMHWWGPSSITIADGELCSRCFKKIVGHGFFSYDLHNLFLLKHTHLSELKNTYFTGIVCPYCGNLRAEYIGPNYKFNVLKGALGYALAGPLGVLLGHVTNKSDYYCSRCRRRFTVKDD